MSDNENHLIAYRLRKVAKRTSEQNSDHALFVEAADTLEAADKAITWGDEKIDRLTEQLAAAQAGIADAVAYNEDSRLRAILAQPSTDALEAVKATAWDEGERHESEYLTLTGQFCPHAGCNPYRATTIEGEKP